MTGPFYKTVCRCYTYKRMRWNFNYNVKITSLKTSPFLTMPHLSQYIITVKLLDTPRRLSNYETDNKENILSVRGLFSLSSI